MPLEGAFLIQLTSNFVSRLTFTNEKKFSFFLPAVCGNGSVKNKTLKNDSIFTGKNMLYNYMNEPNIPKILWTF